MVIARVSRRLPAGRDHAKKLADEAAKAGWQHVTVTADAVHGTYNVGADEPESTGSDHR